MQLKSVQIKNFRSIKDLTLNLSGDLYCLIGKNESGKSNILKAIACLSDFEEVNEKDYKKLNKSLKGADIVGDFEFSKGEYELVNNGIVKLNHDGYRTYSPVIGMRVYARKKLDEKNRITLLHSYDNEIDVFKFIEENPFTENMHAFVSLINMIKARIPYYEHEDFLIKPVAIDELLTNPDDPTLQSFIKLLKLGGVDNLETLRGLEIDEIIEVKASISEKLNDLLSKYYKQDISLKVSIDSHDGNFSLHFKDAYQKFSTLEERSTGFQYFFAFLINKIYLSEHGSRNAVILLDEPALSLHPTGQKDFIKLLEKVSKEHQILYTTHSPFLINKLKSNYVWVIEKDSDFGTILETKPYQKNWRPLRTSLGIDISDSFFYGDKSLLVEGPEDRIIIGTLLSYFSFNEEIVLKSDLLSIIDSGSISNMPAMVQILLDENRPLFVLMDADDTSVHNRLRKKEIQVNDKTIFSIARVNEIDNEAVSIEDLLPIDLYCKAVENYLSSLMKEGIITLIDPLTPPDFSNVKSPKRYNTVAEKIVSSYESTDPQNKELDKKTPVSKIGIAHEFEKLIHNNPDFEQESKKCCLKLVNLIASKLMLI